MRWMLYNLLFALGFPLMLPKFLFRMWRRGGYRRHFVQRFGCYGADVGPSITPAAGPIWIHGVSVGEVAVAAQLIRALRAEAPEWGFVLSTNTSTGFRQAQQATGPRDRVIYAPLDYPWIVRRALRRLHPRALILTESELWPNLIRATHRRGIPLFLVNARLSDRSFRGYRRLRFWFAPLLGMFSRIQVQSSLDAARLSALGAPADRLRATGSFKYDGAQRNPDGEARAFASLRCLWGETPARLTLMGGSTWPGEERVMLDIFRTLRAEHPELRLILAPRHAERAAQVAERIRAAGLSCTRLSRFSPAPSTVPATSDTLLLIDTTGDLMRFYATADLVFVGKTLCAHGGQNMIEPVACGKATLVGPHTENFRSIMADLLEADAIRQVPDAETLADACRALLADADARARLARNAADVIERRRGVSHECAREIATLLTNPAGMMPHVDTTY